MGRRGPAPVPTYLLMRRGSWRARSRAHEPQPQRGIGPCPEWLQPNAKVAWDRLTGWMVECGMIVRIDAQMLARYCDAWARWIQAARFLNEHGESFPIRDRHGHITGYKPFPQLDQYHSYDRLLQQLGREFGFDADIRLRAVMNPDGPYGTDPPRLAEIRTSLYGDKYRVKLPE